MQIAKKYLTEGLIQFTILLSLIGVRVDVDSYLNGYYTPLLEISLGPSSAYTQTPFHSLRDTLDGYSVHPKCPELDYFFASRRLLDEVRNLGSPRFPTQLNAWLLHQVPDTDKPESGESSEGNNSADISLGSESTGGDDGDDCEHLPGSNGPVDYQTSHHLFGQGPYSPGAREEENLLDKEEEPALQSQLAHSIALEQESLLDSNAAVFDPAHSQPPAIDIDQQWSHFLSLPVSDLDDLDPLDTECFTDRNADITSTISQDVSLHEAMVTRTTAYDMISERTAATMPIAQQQAPFLRLESTNSSHSHSSLGMTMDLAALPFASVCNVTRNLSSHVPLDGCLDEAVFDQINLLCLDGLGSIDSQMLDNLEAIDPRLLEDLDSDSGLSLENSSRDPASPGTSEVSSSSSSYYEDGSGATGYTSEVDSIPSKGIFDHHTSWPSVDLSESVWHDHSYSSPAFHHPAVASFPHKGIKEESFSEEEDQRMVERELSRDELRARAMCIPFSAMQIVNMPVEKFMDVLEGHGFSPEQVTLLRDIRRRGKNKLAAQNCRKRKLDAIRGLQGEVEKLQAQRDRLFREKQLTAKTLGAVSQQIEQLTRDILSRMRNELGQPLNPQRYTLQCGANGRVVVHLIRRPVTSTTTENKNDKRKKDKKL